MDGQDRDRPTAHRSPEPAGDPDLLAHLRDTAAALARIVDDGNRAARNLSGVLDQLGGAAAAPSSSRCRDLTRCCQAASRLMGGCPPRAEWPR